MSWLKRFVHICRNLFQSSRIENDLDEEVRSYYDTLVNRFIAQGLSPQDAQGAARLQCEVGPDEVKEIVRQTRPGTTFETIGRDLQYALRTLHKNPAFTIVSVLTLALGIGANTAMFSLINAVILQTLPVHDPSRLVLLTDPTESGVAPDTTEHGVRTILSYPEYLELRRHNRVFSSLLAAQSEVSELDVYSGNSSQTFKARTQLVSGEFFQLLGITPLAGQVFTPKEDQAPGANPVAVVSYNCWQRIYGANPNIIGNTIRVGNGVFHIIGIAPAGFHGILIGADPDFWFPITMQSQVLPGRDYLTPHDTLWLQVMGRLADGVSVETAQAGINTAFQQTLRLWAAELPTPKLRDEKLREKIELRPGARGASDIRGAFSTPLLLLMAMVGVFLLIACTNLANLMLARASGRQREIGLRLALGASRGRLVRQLLTESLLLCLLGGSLGILLSSVATRALLSLVSTGVDHLDLQVPVDSHVLLFTTAISVLTGLTFGLVPALRGTKLDLNSALGVNTRSALGQRSGIQTGRILIVAQVALSSVLLTDAALFVTSLHNLLTRNLGYDAEHLLLLTVDPLSAGYKGPAALAMFENLRSQLQKVPGVRSATLSQDGLFAGDSGDHLSIEGSSEQNAEQLTSSWTEVGANYFTTLRIPMLRGREIEPSDVARNTPVCVVNASFLHRFYPNGDAIGKHITDEYPTTRETFEIIGVAADSIEHAIARDAHARQDPRFYANIAHPIGSVEDVTYILNTSTQPTAVAAAARQTVQRFNPALPILELRTLDQQIGRRVITQRLLADLAAFFAALALALAVIGLYGVMSYSVGRRINEIGIRMALGANAIGITKMVLAETFLLVVIGAAIGLPCAFATARALSSQLFGVTAADPISLAIALMLILASALLAGYLPARRAARADPMLCLRHD